MTTVVFLSLLALGAGPFVLLVGWIMMLEFSTRKRSKAFRRRMDAYKNTDRLPLGGKLL